MNWSRFHHKRHYLKQTYRAISHQIYLITFLIIVQNIRIVIPSKYKINNHYFNILKYRTALLRLHLLFFIANCPPTNLISYGSIQLAFGIIQLFHSKEFMNPQLNQTHISHQKAKNHAQIIKPLSNLRQKDQVFVAQGSRVYPNGKLWMEGCISSNSDESQSDGQSSLSFQCNLLEQHKMVLQNVISKNQILLNKYTQIINREFLNSRQNFNPIFKTIRLEQYLDNMLAKFRKFKPALVNKFNWFLETEKNFYKFLLHIYHSFSDIIVAKAIKLIFFIWELYIPYHKMKLELKDIQTLVSLIAHKICQNEYSTGRKENIKNNEQRQCYCQMIEILTMTTLLVIQECFENPYLNKKFSMEESVTKAQIDKELKSDEECLDVCHKKIKQQSSIYFST